MLFLYLKDSRKLLLEKRASTKKVEHRQTSELEEKRLTSKLCLLFPWFQVGSFWAVCLSVTAWRHKQSKDSIAIGLRTSGFWGFGSRPLNADVSSAKGGPRCTGDCAAFGRAVMIALKARWFSLFQLLWFVVSRV